MQPIGYVYLGLYDYRVDFNVLLVLPSFSKVELMSVVLPLIGFPVE